MSPHAADNSAGGQSGRPSGPVGEGDYVAREGDCISSIAADHGHFWRTLWDDANNRRLREARKDPNCLLPGDRVFIPEKRQKEESGETDAEHTFRRKGEPAKLRFRVLEFDEPRANEPYLLDVDGRLTEGTTDGEGNVELSIRGNARRARLTLTNDGTCYDLELGGMDPVSEVSGVQRRLNNLGYDCGEVDGVLGERTREALRRFQAAHGLEQTGEQDEPTRSKLEQEHGS